MNPLYRVLFDTAVCVEAQKKTASAYAASTAALGNAPQRERYPKRTSYYCQAAVTSKSAFLNRIGADFHA
jgi:hypothetical protein